MPKPTAQVVQFRPSSAPPPIVEIAVTRRSPGSLPVDETPALDLSGKPRVVLLIGSGNTGKTTMARWIVERKKGEPDRQLVSAVATGTVTLGAFVDNVAHPDGRDPGAFLGELLAFLMEGKHQAVIDLGGNDTSLGTVLEQLPDLTDMLEEAGLAPVALYTLSPRTQDLAELTELEFLPPATALVLNTGLVPAGMSAATAFETTLAQPQVKAAIAGGARVIWMPRLDPPTAKHIEDQTLSFTAAQSGAKSTSLYQRAMVRGWLDRMKRAFAPIGSWLP